MKEGRKASKTEVLSENYDCVGTNRKTGTADGVVKPKETQEERCLVPPVFVTPLITRLVPEGKVVVMETEVFSRQAVDFTWLFNHQPITPSSSSYAISNKNYKSILFIYDACQNLAGEYTCIANNDAGVATTSAYLIVEEPKSETEPPCFNVHLSPSRWSTAEPIRLVCYVSGQPFPRIRWYHNRTELLESKRVFMSLEEDGRCELTIQKASPEDAGEYICEAVNKWGETTTKTRVEIESCEDSLILDQVTSGEAKEQLEEMIYNGECYSVHESGPKYDCMASESEDHPSKETNILNRLQGEDDRPYNVVLPKSTEKMEYSNKDEGREEGHSRDCLASLIPPLQIKVTGPSSISIQWNDDHSIPVLGYCIFMRDVKQKIWMEVSRVDGHTKQVTVRDLQEDHKYFVRIIAFSEAGVSEPLTNKSPVRVVRPADVIVPPAAPEGPLKISDVTEDSVKLSWQTSKNDGGAEITAYVIEAKDVLETEVVKHYRRVAATETSYLMSGLKKGHLFLFRVSAENAAGVGPTLINKTPVRIRAIRMKPSPPGKPAVNLSREAGDSVHLSWTPPEVTGSATIRTYIVERYDLLSDIWMRINREEFTSPVFTVTGLQPGLEYIYRVSAENEVGISEPGPSSEPVIIRTKRVVAPPIFTLKLENCKVVEENDVTFYCEFSGSPSPEITWYKGGIQVFDSSRVTIHTDNTSSSLTLRNVKVADSGKFECQALSVSGLVTTRAQLSVDAPPKVIIPSRYLNGLFFDCGETLCVKVSINGNPTPDISWWRSGRQLQEDSRIEILVDGDRSILKIHNIEPNDEGEYVVVVSNELGSSSESFRVTVTDKPHPPEGRPVVSDVDWKSCVLCWQPPKYDGGSPITSYLIEKRSLEMSVWVRAASSHKSQVTIYDLVDGTMYAFRVRAINIYGTSDPSAESDSILIPEISSEYCAARKYDNNVHTLPEVTDKELYSFPQDTVSEEVVGENFNYIKHAEDELYGTRNKDELFGKTNEDEFVPNYKTRDELMRATDEETEDDLLLTTDSGEDWELASEGIVETLEDNEDCEAMHSSASEKIDCHLIGNTSSEREDEFQEGLISVLDIPSGDTLEPKQSAFPSVFTVPAIPLLTCLIYEPFVWEVQTPISHKSEMSSMHDEGTNAEIMADIRSLEPLISEVCYAHWTVEDIPHCAALLSLFPRSLELAKPFNSRPVETNHCRTSLTELLFMAIVSQHEVQYCEAVGWFSVQTFVCNIVLELPNHVLCVNILPPLLLQTTVFSTDDYGKLVTDQKLRFRTARTIIEPCVNYLFIQLPPPQEEVVTVMKSTSLKGKCRAFSYLRSLTVAETSISTNLECVELITELIEQRPSSIIHQSFILPKVGLSQSVHTIGRNNNSSDNESYNRNRNKKDRLISVDSHDLKEDIELDNCKNNPPALVRSPAAVNLGHILQHETSKPAQKDIHFDFEKTLGWNLVSELSESEDSDSKPSSTEENNDEDSTTEIYKVAEGTEKDFETKANETETLENTLAQEFVSLERDIEILHSLQEQFDIESYNKINKAKLEITCEGDENIPFTLFNKVQEDTSTLNNSEDENGLLHPLRRLHRTQLYGNQKETFETRDQTSPCHEKDVNLRDRRRCGRLENREVSPPHVITHLENRLIPAGYRVKLTCWILADPEPRIQWLKNGAKLQPKLRHLAVDMYEFGLCSLEIYNAKPSDTGQYTCVATNCFGTCSTSGYLRVGGERERSPESPRFEKLASDVTAVIGTTITLEWLVRGVPPPRVSWKKNTHRLQEDWRVDTYSNHRGLCRLVIRDVNPSDTAAYSCVIENESGKQAGMAMVLVQNGVDENGNLKEITSRLLQNQQITEDFDENIEIPEESNLSRWRHTHVGHNLYTANTRTSKLCSRFKDVTSGLPGRPLDPQVVEQGVTWVTLAWSRPLADGGSPVLTYKIEFRVLHSNRWHEVGLSRATLHDVHGLQKNKTYCFRISAQNRFGWGPSVSLTHPVLMR